MKKKIAVILGDGIGQEVTEQSIKVLNIIAKQFKHEFSYEHALMGAIAIDKTGNPLPDETIKICLASDAILFGAIGDPKYDNDPTSKLRPEQGLLKLRKELQFNPWDRIRYNDDFNEPDNPIKMNVAVVPRPLAICETTNPGF